MKKLNTKNTKSLCLMTETVREITASNLKLASGGAPSPQTLQPTCTILN